MKLAEIVSITGMPGLFKVLTKKGDGVIVTSLTDGKSQFVSARTHLFSSLDNITIYTTDENKALKDVFAEMKKQEGAHAPAAVKSDEEIKKYIAAIIPDYDREKVYLSDMKKLIKWYNLLNDKKLIEELLKDEATAEEAASDDAPIKETKPAKAKKQSDAPKKEPKPKGEKVSKVATKAAPVKKITTPRKAS